MQIQEAIIQSESFSSYVEDKYIGSADACKATAAEVDALDLYRLFGLFFLSATGCMLTLLMFLAEKLLYQFWPQWSF